MKLLQDTESLQERQRRWNAVTSPAMRLLSQTENLELRQSRGKFAGVFTRLVARSERRGLTLTPEILVRVAEHSFCMAPEDPAGAVKLLAEILQTEIEVRLHHLENEADLRNLVKPFAQTQQTLL